MCFVHLGVFLGARAKYLLDNSTSQFFWWQSVYVQQPPFGYDFLLASTAEVTVGRGANHNMRSEEFHHLGVKECKDRSRMFVNPVSRSPSLRP